MTEHTQERSESIISVLTAYLHSQGLAFIPHRNIKVEKKPSYKILRGLKVVRKNKGSRCWHYTIRNMLGSLGFYKAVEKMMEHPHYLKTKLAYQTLSSEERRKYKGGMDEISWLNLLKKHSFIREKQGRIKSFQEIYQLFHEDHPVVINYRTQEGHTVSLIGVDAANKSFVIADNYKIKVLPYKQYVKYVKRYRRHFLKKLFKNIINLRSIINNSEEVKQGKIKKIQFIKEHFAHLMKFKKVVWQQSFIQYQGKRGEVKPTVTKDYVKVYSYLDSDLTRLYNELQSIWMQCTTVSFYSTQDVDRWIGDIERSLASLEKKMKHLPADPKKVSTPPQYDRRLVQNFCRNGMPSERAVFLASSDRFVNAILNREWSVARLLLSEIDASMKLILMKEGKITNPYSFQKITYELRKAVDQIALNKNEELLFNKYSSYFLSTNNNNKPTFISKQRQKIHHYIKDNEFISKNKGYFLGLSNLGTAVGLPLLTSLIVDFALPRTHHHTKDAINAGLGLSIDTFMHRRAYYQAARQLPFYNQSYLSYQWREFMHSARATSRAIRPLLSKKAAVITGGIVAANTVIKAQPHDPSLYTPGSYHASYAAMSDLTSNNALLTLLLSPFHWSVHCKPATNTIRGSRMVLEGKVGYGHKSGRGAMVAAFGRVVSRSFRNVFGGSPVYVNETPGLTKSEKMFLKESQDKSYLKRYVQYYDIIKYMSYLDIKDAAEIMMAPNPQDLQMSYSSQEAKKANISMTSLPSRIEYEIDFQALEKRLRTGHQDAPVFYINQGDLSKKIPIDPNFTLNRKELLELEKFIQQKRLSKGISNSSKLNFQKLQNGQLRVTPQRYMYSNRNVLQAQIIEKSKNLLRLKNELQSIRLLNARSKFSYYLTKATYIMQYIHTGTKKVRPNEKNYALKKLQMIIGDDANLYWSNKGRRSVLKGGKEAFRLLTHLASEAKSNKRYKKYGRHFDKALIKAKKAGSKYLKFLKTIEKSQLKKLESAMPKLFASLLINIEEMQSKSDRQYIVSQIKGLKQDFVGKKRELKFAQKELDLLFKKL